MATMHRRVKRRRPMSEINVVPYIDVMLVLLIIFMVTAPLLNLGVDIDLPQSQAEPLNQHDGEPVVVTVNAQGDLHLELGGQRELVDEEALVAKISAFVRQNPDVPVYVGGDQRVEYGRVYQAMVMLQRAGVPKVGLMSQPLEGEP